MIVIADDITGAAEIAGIAFSKGLKVHLVCGRPACSCATAKNEATVIATDTRSMTEAEAIAETRRIASALGPQSSPIFKKTDSALRGHVVAELSALMQATGCRRVVYLPANPSKGRIIRNGIYYINETPVAETDFSYDPEFPARTSVLHERFPDAEEKGIIMPDATSIDDIRQAVATNNDGQTIFAGAADLWDVTLGSGTSVSSRADILKCPDPNVASTLILCGSTQSRPLDLGIPIAPMPVDLYDGSSDLTLWKTDSHHSSLILTIPHQHRTGKAIAVHLRTLMARKTKALVESHRPDHLIIEGGATAWAVLQALGWNRFEIRQQVSSGVVTMEADNGTLVTLKPGSYPWGQLFKKT